jgi:hypothetical protein
MNGVSRTGLRKKQDSGNLCTTLRWPARFGPTLYCNADWVSFTAQYGFAVPPDTLHFCPFTDPGAIVEK